MPQDLDITPRQMAAIEHDIRTRARRHVRARLGLAWHCVIYVMANVAMFAINQRYSPAIGWYIWPLAAWGAGLALHAFATLSATGTVEEMVEAEIARERQRRGLA
jgi:hypothetical protein